MLSLIAASAVQPTAVEPLQPVSGAVPLEPSHHHHHKEKHSHKKHHAAHSFKGDLPDGSGTAPCADGCSADDSSPTALCSPGGGCWPRFYLLGVQKAGTTSVFRALQQGAGVCGATYHTEPGNNYYKEAHFFDRDKSFPDGLTTPNTGKAAYTRLYNITSNCPGNTFMDATPASFYDSDVPVRMKATLPPSVQSVVRMVVILREPVGRDLSLFNMFKQQWMDRKVKASPYLASQTSDAAIEKLFCHKPTNGEFPTYADAVNCNVNHYDTACGGGGQLSSDEDFASVYGKCKYTASHFESGKHNRFTDGFYLPQLEAFTKSGFVGRSRVLTLSFESLLAEQSDHLSRIVRFLGLTVHGADGTTLLSGNATGNAAGLALPHANDDSFVGQVSTINCNTSAKLNKLYKPWNDRLYAALAVSQTAGESPSMEPAFPPFTEIQCGDEEVTFGRRMAREDKAESAKEQQQAQAQAKGTDGDDEGDVGEGEDDANDDDDDDSTSESDDNDKQKAQPGHRHPRHPRNGSPSTANTTTAAGADAENAADNTSASAASAMSEVDPAGQTGSEESATRQGHGLAGLVPLEPGHHHHSHHGRHGRGSSTEAKTSMFHGAPKFGPVPPLATDAPQSHDAPMMAFPKVQPSAPRPHILLWVTDDQGWGNVGYHNEIVHTPNMDSLSKDGIRLNRHYTASWCVPSRASLMTGRFPHNMVQNKGHSIPEDVKMIPAVLAKGGYVSHQVGKWHLGYQRQWQLPYRRGFNTSFGYLGSVNDYYTQHQTAESWPCDGIDLWRTDGPAYGEDGTFSLPLYGDEVVKIINQHDPSRPLFMYVALQAMHSPAPTEVPETALYPGYSDGFAIGNGLISAADKNLGDAVAALKSKQMWDKTLLVHTSDNGASVTPLKSEVRGTNYPLRGGKNTNLEGGVRVPAFITGGAVPVGRRGNVEDGYVHISDWYTTFAALAGVQLTPEQFEIVDGKNMWPWLSGQVKESPRQMMVLGATNNRKGATDAIINGNYKLIRGFVICDGWTDADYPSTHHRRSDDLDCDPGGGNLVGEEMMLFDIKNDESERYNLIGNASYASVQASMTALMEKVLAHHRTVLNQNPDELRDDTAALCTGFTSKHKGYLGPYLD